MQGLVIIVICISPFVNQVLSQCNMTKLEHCMEIYTDALKNASHASYPDPISTLKVSCSPSVKSAIACYTHELALCPDYFGNLDAEIKSHLHDVYINSTSQINTYCSTIENLSPEFITCLSKMMNDTIPPKPGGYRECMFSNPLYNATITSGHILLTDTCILQEVGHKCGVQYIKQHCPDQVNDFNNYYQVSSGSMHCPEASDLSPEFIACLSKMINDTIPPKPGGYLECMFSNPLYNATITSGHLLTDTCRLQEVGHKCGVQYIKQHCPDQVNDYNNYYQVSSGSMHCPEASVMTPIVG